MNYIYLDNNATTPLAPEVLQAMLPYYQEHFGNPSSAHELGREARKTVDRARQQTAAFLGARHDTEIIFTASGSEANNWAIHSAVRSAPQKKHVITTAVEHHSVLNPIKVLEKEGWRVSWLKTDDQGQLDLRELEQALSADTALVSIMAVNNETGNLFPYQEIAARVKTYATDISVHVDGVQLAGKKTVLLQDTGIDFFSFSAHKIHGPKGVGGLYARKGMALHPWILGGGQERGRRAGTENVAGIAGLAKACELAAEYLPRESELAALRDRLEKAILFAVPEVRINTAEERICNTTNMSFSGMDSESLLISLSQMGVCASSGSACMSGAAELSHVLLAMGYEEDRVKGAVRFSLSRYNTAEEIDRTAEAVARSVEKLRKIKNC